MGGCVELVEADIELHSKNSVYCISQKMECIVDFAAILLWCRQRYEYLLLKVETNGQDDLKDKTEAYQEEASSESYHMASGLCSKTIYWVRTLLIFFILPSKANS